MFVAIDGLDGSGKESLTRALIPMLTNAFEEQTDVYLHSFPDYEVSSGRKIREFLHDKNTMNKIPSTLRPYMIGMMFAYNRAEHFADWERRNEISLYKTPYGRTIHVFDRYWASNILYQCVGMDMSNVAKYMKMFLNIEKNFENPLPDVYLFLRHPYSILQSRISKRNDNDVYEEDGYQKAVYWFSERLLDEMQTDRIRSESIFSFTYDKIIDGSIKINDSLLSPYNELSVSELCDKVMAEIYEWYNRIGNTSK